VKKAAAELAATDGVSLNQFIAAAVAEKVGSLRVADDFLRERAGAYRRYIHLEDDSCWFPRIANFCAEDQSDSKRHGWMALKRLKGDPHEYNF
jgi:hypothetical protein